MTKMRFLAVGLVVATVLAGCSDGSAEPTLPAPADPTTTAGVATTTTSATTSATTTSTTTAATTTTAAPEPVLYEYSIAVGPDGVEYQLGAEELETVGPTQVAAANGTVYIADPVGDILLVVDQTGSRAIDLIEMDILNVAAMTATADKLYLVEVFFAPVRQRLHTLSLSGELEASIDLPPGAQLEDGLSGVIVDDRAGPTIVIAGGAQYADPIDGSHRESIDIGAHQVTQAGSDIAIDGVLIDAGLNGRLGGLRLLGNSAEATILVREEVLATDPIIDVLASVEWYAGGSLVGSALVPLDQQAISAPPGLTVTPEGRVLLLLAQNDAVRTVELTPSPGRITGTGG